MTAPRRDALTRAVSQALHHSPVSLLRLGRLTRLPQSTLWRIANGELGATARVANAVATALEKLGRTCGEAARVIRRAQQAASKQRTP